MDDIRVEIHMEQHFANGTREEGKALAVIVKSIQPGAFEIVFVV